ncbi:hypothetical protein F4780DRAFT_449659 [Xylariomycetidae sp. FL0641]|nr:hypothetical protein F4780DRAFT_449659 [Xylariomycetidae sp. FL0641]
MKYGQQFAQASVPAWNLHNIDYNSLKEQIRRHTARDQATAIAIPGQIDPALKRFEDDFYADLCNQHDRVDLFVSSKADEIRRRLDHLSGQVQQLIQRCTTSPRNVSVKQKRRFAKYEQQIEDCGEDIRALNRFVNAQIIAFQKILKKYKVMQKWTGSATLGGRFKDKVLNSPKSFSSFDFQPLQLQYREVLNTLRAASPSSPTPSLPHSRPRSYRAASTSPQHGLSRHSSSHRRGASSSATRASPAATAPQVNRYWNEYEHGSEAGDFADDDGDDGEYAIYIDPNAPGAFHLPGFTSLKAALAGTMPKWLRKQRADSGSSTTLVDGDVETQQQQQQRRPLLSPESPADYFSIARRPPSTATSTTTPGGQTSDNDHGPRVPGYVSSSDEIQRAPAPPLPSPPPRFFPYHAPPAYYHHRQPTLEDRLGSYYLPDEGDYKLALYRERVLRRGVVLAFGLAFALLVVSGLLATSGRRKLRLQVDAGVTVGSAASLFCACLGLGAMLYRRYPPGGAVCYCYALAVWAAFLAVCALNGMLLVLVVGSNGI